MKVKAIKLLLR